MPSESSATPMTDALFNTEDGFVGERRIPDYIPAARYYGLQTGTEHDNLGYNLGRWGRSLRDTPLGKGVARSFNHPASGFFAGAIPSLLMGAGGQALLNYFGLSNQYRNPWLTGAYTAALGGALGGTLGDSRHHWMNKASASWRSGPQDPYQEIYAALQSAGLDPGTQNDAFMAIQQLAPSDASQLARMVGGAFGAAAGALIVRFLTGRGLMRAAIGAGVGGLLGSLFGGALGGGPSTMNGFAF